MRATLIACLALGALVGCGGDDGGGGDAGGPSYEEAKRAVLSLPEVKAACPETNVEERERDEELPDFKVGRTLFCDRVAALLIYYEFEDEEGVETAIDERVLIDGGTGGLPPENYTHFVNGRVLIWTLKTGLPNGDGILEPKAVAEAVHDACDCGEVRQPE